ncbi:HAD family hydrolase [Nocardioides seonyuensis]|uniref:HAD family hydrolase n=1 Tax=Nocardioides seonyuensis TaxID=2518371 RepID=A0A4P7IJV7_9ACTN|nr:HAD family hydrolase [Nocardioides seonyuensis]
MGIRAVVFDVGGVLEVIDDSLFPGPAETRLGLDTGALLHRISDLPAGAATGLADEVAVRRHWQRCLRLDDQQADELMSDFWRWYIGTVNVPLRDWFASQRQHRLTAILSNSAPGAREAERCHGFEDITDDIVYSHEVGLSKPDPEVFSLAAERLGVSPHEVLFLDDVEENVTAGRDAGWHAVLHRDTPSSIAAMEAIIEAAG